MRQNILEARIKYNGLALHSIAVLVEMSKGDVRAIIVTTKPKAGYMHISADATLSDALLQEVADYGLETVDREEIFPNWRRYL